MSESLEITTVAPCTINCTFCPHDAYLSAYGKSDLMKLDEFKRALATVPKSVRIVFSGFSEPFLNPNAVDMMEHASDQGHKLRLFSTLVGLSKEDVKRLASLKLELFVLHLPDNLGNAKIPSNATYRETLDNALRSLRIDNFAVMNENFSANTRAGLIKLSIKKHKRGIFWCTKLYSNQFVMLPNCDVVLCCRDFALRHKLGNLLQQSYKEISESKVLRMIRSNSYHFNGDCLCRECESSSISYNVKKIAKHLIENSRRKISNHRSDNS